MENVVVGNRDDGIGIVVTPTPSPLGFTVGAAGGGAGGGTEIIVATGFPTT